MSNSTLTFSISPPVEPSFLSQRFTLARAELSEICTLAAQADSVLRWQYVGYRCKGIGIALFRLMQCVAWPSSCNMRAPSRMAQTTGEGRA